MDTKYIIREDLLDAFVGGYATPEETALVLRAMENDPRLREEVGMLLEMEAADDEGRAVPLARAAADAEGNLCDAMCEARILRDYIPSGYAAGYIDDTPNVWVRSDGTPLHRIGEGLRQAGMSVARRFDATLDDVRAAIAAHCRMVAVVDGGTLRGEGPSEKLHAVAVLGGGPGTLAIYDPAGDRDTDVDEAAFDRAWEASRRYLVTASRGRLEYVPHPIYTYDVTIDDDLIGLADAIAENAHETQEVAWAAEGWRYGEIYDEHLRIRPDMVPFADLPAEARAAVREAALATLRLAKKLGFRISRPGRHLCPDCGQPLERTFMWCPGCGRELTHKDFYAKDAEADADGWNAYM